MQVHAALSDFGRIFEVLGQMLFTDIQQLDADVLAEVRLIDQRLRPTPDRLYTLKVRMMHHFVQLTADLGINRGNVFVQQGPVQTLHFRGDLLEPLKKNTYRRSNTLIGCCLRQNIHTLVGVDTAHLLKGFEIYFFKQCVIDILAVFHPHSGATRLRRGLLFGHLLASRL